MLKCHKIRFELPNLGEFEVTYSSLQRNVTYSCARIKSLPGGTLLPLTCCLHFEQKQTAVSKKTGKGWESMVAL